MTEMLSMVIKDSLLHNRPQLSQNQCCNKYWWASI